LKQIINKKQYDTEKAEILTSYQNGLSPSDFYYESEELYITANNNFFLAGEGGACTKYAYCYGGYTSKGERIIPLTKEEAYKWLEQKGEAEIIETYFSNEIEEA
jgi:hypothetical protein